MKMSLVLAAINLGLAFVVWPSPVALFSGFVCGFCVAMAIASAAIRRDADV